MGRSSIEDVLSDDGVPRDVALSYHLRSNHFPPIIDGEGFALLAIEAVEEGEYDRFIDDGTRRGIAGEVVEAWHLDFFLSDEAAGREEE